MLESIESAGLWLRRGGIAKDLLVVVILVSIVLVLLWPSLFLDKTLLPVDILLHFSPWSYYSNRPPIWNSLPSDAVLFFYPWKVFIARAIQVGTIPLWNPYVMSGTPFIANSQAAIFYPFNLLFLIFPALRAYAIFVALHLFLAGSFTYFYLRTISVSRAGSLLGGIAFMSSPFLIGSSEHLSLLGIIVWLPLIFILLDKMLLQKNYLYAFGVGIVLGIQMLGGHFQFSFFVLFASVLYFVFRFLWLLKERADVRSSTICLLLMAVAMVVGLALSAVQFIPQPGGEWVPH